MVLKFLVVAGLTYVACEAYKKYTSTEEKRKWEKFIKVHHGEAGALMLGAGILAKSPSLAASGVGLMLHDREDYKKWFAKDKTRYDGAV